MKKVHPYLFLFLFALSGTPLFAQTESNLPDGNFIQYMRGVVSFHPFSRQADLELDMAEAKLRKARGSFDPNLYGDYDDKEYEGSNYWDVGEIGIELPTRTGIKVKSAYTWNQGSFLDNRETIPAQGQGVLGVSVPLGNGLLIDPKRAELRQAQIGIEMGDIKQILLLNDLLWQAGMAYWDVQSTVSLQKRLAEAEGRALVRFQAIREGYLQGAYAVADTLDAYNQWKQFSIQNLQAIGERQEQSLLLNAFTWNEQGRNVENDSLSEDLDSFSRFGDVFYSATNQRLLAIQDHPALRLSNTKINQLDVDRKLAREQLKPTLNLNYNMLTGKDAFPAQGQSAEMQEILDLNLNQNYKWGLEASFPIFMRKARGKVDIANIKLETEQLNLKQKEIDLTNKLKAQIQVLAALEGQLELQEELTQNLERLLRIEEARLSVGESDLFVINSREQKLISAQQKLIVLQRKFHVTQLKTLWTAGLLPEVIGF